MPDHAFAGSIRTMQRFFNTTTKCFDESDAAFAAKPGMFTVAQHIAHTAQVVRWFVDGAFSSQGMDLDFEKMEKEVRKVTTLYEARDWFESVCADVIKIVESKSAAEFAQPIAGTIMAGERRSAIFEALADHTAHHRGALAVYARLVGKVPAMPYAASE